MMVIWAVENDITNGLSTPYFGVDENQIVTFLWCIAGGPAPARTDHPFTDVADGTFLYEYPCNNLEEKI